MTFSPETQKLIDRAARALAAIGDAWNEAERHQRTIEYHTMREIAVSAQIYEMFAPVEEIA